MPTRRPGTTRCGARSRPASTGSTPRRSTATARRRRRSAGICSRSCRGPTSPPRCGSKPTTWTTLPARSSAASSRASSGCGSDRVALFQLHNHLGHGGRRAARAVAGAGARPRRRRRHLRPAQGAGAHPRQRHHRGRRHRGVPRGDQQRPLRRRAGLLQRDQSERRLARACRRAGRAAGLLRPARGLLPSEHGHAQHPASGPAALLASSAAARAACS